MLKIFFLIKTGKKIFVYFVKGGSVTSEDFQNYKALVKKPIIVNIDAEHRLYTLPPPSSGVLVAFIMRVMRGKLNYSLFFKIN
jgi:gamma-glutamyltranspeptidase